MCSGNGLKADVWNDFRDRFRITQILEFYAATEGNFSLFNIDGKPGAIGRIPSYLVHRFTAALVKFDVQTNEPVRNAEEASASTAIQTKRVKLWARFSMALRTPAVDSRVTPAKKPPTGKSSTTCSREAIPG